LIFAQDGSLFLHHLGTNQRVRIISGFDSINDPAWSRALP
jgi:hypothetical protein